MKRIISIALSCMMMIGGWSALAINQNAKVISMQFAMPKFIESNEGYIQLCPEGEELYIMSPGKPMLPRVVKVIELPFGVRNVTVSYTHLTLPTKA